MKKKTKLLFCLAFIISVICYNIQNRQKSNNSSSTDFSLSEVEAMASCEVKRNGKVIFKCVGDEQADCQEKYKAVFAGTIEIECSGVYVEL